MIAQADARHIPLADETVQCCVTSPPYWGLRDYGVEGQLGLEESPEVYVSKMVEVFREVKRVLRRDGTLWLNIGDSYAGSGAGSGGNRKGNEHGQHDDMAQLGRPGVPSGLKPKDLVGIPWMLAFALRADGWWLRSDIIWAKPNPMPESVTDRPTKSHEYVFLLTKAATYYWDAEAVKEPVCDASLKRAEYGWDCDRPSTKNASMGGTGIHTERMGERFVNPSGRNLRSVWNIATQPFKGAHFATFPQKLAETCIKAGTSERGCCPKCGGPWERVVERTKPPADVYTGTVKPDSIAPVSHPELGKAGMGQKLQNWYNEHPVETLGWRPTCSCGEADTRPCVVLDPFSGAGTTGLVALRLNRDAILIELNPAYTEMARERCAQVQPVMMTT